MTIRKRLTLWYAGLLISIIVLFGTITFFVVRLTMIDNLDNTLRESATQIMVNSRLVAIPTTGTQPRIDIQLAALDVFRASNVYVQAWEIVDGVPGKIGQRVVGEINIACGNCDLLWSPVAFLIID